MSTQRVLLSLALGALASTSAHAGLTVGSASYTYGQSFDTLATTGTTNAWANDSTIAGWSLFKTNTTTPVTTYIGDSGTSNTGGIHSYGSSADRALGSIGSGSFPLGWIAVSFTNASGAALSGFNIGFDGEQWRNGGNTSAHSMVMEYGFGATFDAVGAWTAPGGNFSWTSPVIGATAAAVDGNVAGLQAGRGGAVTTDWAAGDTLWVRWIEVDNTGADHGLAIDNVSFSVVAAAVPEPQSYALLLAGLACVGFIARRRKA